MNKTVIETRDLTRYFGKKRIVAPLNLSVPRGSIFGFLGRNGAGKSTTIRMLLGLLEPTRGTSIVLGEDSRHLSAQTRGRIGYLAEGHHVYGWMSIRECAKFQSSSFAHWNDKIFEGVIRHFGLEPGMKAGNLSRGQRAGLCLALTLAPGPELLILDDPALGLDPVARRSLLQSMLFVARGEGRTILFSSHLLSDVERVADHIAILDNGVLRANCPLDTFRESVRQFVLHFAGDVPILPPLPGLLQSFRTPGEIALTFANFDENTMARLESLGAFRIEEVPLSLEDAFISYLSERGEKSFFLQENGADGAIKMMDEEPSKNVSKEVAR
ncbi:MAG TPA: ABC transporter ATP-binding protein [Abditibacteriaceae bacterium]|jgi:ABC-2 type transport system ATP-binding protein